MGFSEGFAGGMSSVAQLAGAIESIRRSREKRKWEREDRERAAEDREFAELANLLQTKAADRKTGQLNWSLLESDEARNEINQFVAQKPRLRRIITEQLTAGSHAEKNGLKREFVGFMPAGGEGGPTGGLVPMIRWKDKDGKVVSQGPMTVNGTNDPADKVVILSGEELVDTAVNLALSRSDSLRTAYQQGIQEAAKGRSLRTITDYEAAQMAAAGDEPVATGGVEAPVAGAPRGLRAAAEPVPMNPTPWQHGAATDAGTWEEPAEPFVAPKNPHPRGPQAQKEIEQLEQMAAQAEAKGWHEIAAGYRQQIERLKSQAAPAAPERPAGLARGPIEQLMRLYEDAVSKGQHEIAEGYRQQIERLGGTVPPPAQPAAEPAAQAGENMVAEADTGTMSDAPSPTLVAADRAVRQKIAQARAAGASEEDIQKIVNRGARAEPGQLTEEELAAQPPAEQPAAEQSAAVVIDAASKRGAPKVTKEVSEAVDHLVSIGVLAPEVGARIKAGKRMTTSVKNLVKSELGYIAVNEEGRPVYVYNDPTAIALKQAEYASKQAKAGRDAAKEDREALYKFVNTVEPGEKAAQRREQLMAQTGATLAAMGWRASDPGVESVLAGYYSAWKQYYDDNSGFLNRLFQGDALKSFTPFAVGQHYGVPGEQVIQQGVIPVRNHLSKVLKSGSVVLSDLELRYIAQETAKAIRAGGSLDPAAIANDILAGRAQRR